MTDKDLLRAIILRCKINDSLTMNGIELLSEEDCLHLMDEIVIELLGAIPIPEVTNVIVKTVNYLRH